MEGLKKELAEMSAADQKVRSAWNEARLNKTADEAAVGRVKEEWLHVDADNFARLKLIFAKHGYLDVGRFGEKASHHFWLLVQHCDQAPEFQLEVLTAMEPLLKSGNINLGDYAYLYDRVHVNTGRLQRYATQLRPKEGGSGYEPQPLEKPEEVDRRRVEVGLPPLAEYLAAHMSIFHKD